MPLKIKADEDLPGSVAVRLRRTGYLVETVVEEGMGGTKGSCALAGRAGGREVSDYGRQRICGCAKVPPGTHEGILLLRPDEDWIGPLDVLVEMVLRKGGLERLRGAVAVATPRGLRIRKS